MVWLGKHRGKAIAAPALPNPVAQSAFISYNPGRLFRCFYGRAGLRDGALTWLRPAVPRRSSHDPFEYSCSFRLLARHTGGPRRAVGGTASLLLLRNRAPCSAAATAPGVLPVPAAQPVALGPLAARTEALYSQSSMDLSNPQEQPKAAEGQEVLEECDLSKGQEVEGTDNAEELKEHSQSNGEAGANVEARHIKAEMGSERALVLDRLASNVAKRKSSMPQKFVGEKRHSFDVNYNSSFAYEKEGDIVQGRMMDQAINNAISFLGAEALRPLVQTPPAPTPEMVPVISTLYPIALPRADVPNGSDDKSHVPLRERALSPNNSGHDSTDTDSNHEERPNPSFPQGPVLPVPRNGLQALKDFPRPYDIIKPPAVCPRDAFKVINKDGEAIGAYRCDHCRVLFLDYVMFTIHMGCHGFRDPFECNVCGYRSHDRYEFSSHIARGEHRVLLK
ncbi:zinc finger protein Aiolos isoform X6 [Tympanuchus pallidicinctus]|uniref:zinc finger protein Aiolos isoform X6 n=1 Tax=Tympanuchus pallidicinctus TaxID=109042 RepID=UPI0022873BDF|nr:zinc finger protein Aiolos isoform X6 [Tympanuchus pallidicinctus]